MRMKWAAAIALIVAGCESHDEKLADFAEHSMETQQRQNEIIGRQSEQVVLESRALAEAAKEVVAADAQARQELISAQREMNQGLQAERAGVHQQRDQLERERRDIAAQRFRDPLIAATLQTLGLLLICIAPLALTAYALRQLHRRVDDGCELGDLLVDELATDRPLLLSAVSRLLLPAESGAPSKDAPSEREPPF
jgi:hypothetical protein